MDCITRLSAIMRYSVRFTYLLTYRELREEIRVWHVWQTRTCRCS